MVKALVEKLGATWTYLDRDHLMEDGICIEDHADDVIDEKLYSMTNVIVDAQVPWRAPKKGEKYILVYAPLAELIKRDEQRKVRLKRSRKRAHYARLYVEKTFSEVFEAPLRFNFQYDALFDSSQYSLESEMKEVLRLVNDRDVFLFSSSA